MLLFKYLFLNVVIYQEIRYFHKVMLILEVNNLLNPTLTKARFMPEASNTLPSNYFNFILVYRVIKIYFMMRKIC